MIKKIKNILKTYNTTNMKPENTNTEYKEKVENINENIEETTEQENTKDTKAGKKKESKDEKLQEMGEKMAELNDKYLRLYSEFENYRKRTNQEKADLIKYGSEEMIKAILPVVDDYERAIQAFDQNEDTAALKEGVVLIYNKLINTLSQKGLKAIEAKGEKFDENLHEAVAQFPATDEEQKGKVIDEVLKGYYLHDKVIRYAKVVVAI
jgi:molecular chaperone GrpE